MRHREHAVADGFVQRRFVAASSESLSHAPTSHLPKYRGTGCEGPRTPWKRNVRTRSSTIVLSVTAEPRHAQALREHENQRALFQKPAGRQERTCQHIRAGILCVPTLRVQVQPRQLQSPSRLPGPSLGADALPAPSRGGKEGRETQSTKLKLLSHSYAPSKQAASASGDTPLHPIPIPWGLCQQAQQVLGTKAPAHLQRPSRTVCCRVNGSCNREMEARTHVTLK